MHSKLLSVTSSFNLVQVVSEPTRVTNNTSTLIDIIFVSSVNYVESCTTISTDHYDLRLKTNLKYQKQLEKGVPTKLWKYSLADFDNINMCLHNVDWDALLTGDVNEQWLNWNSCFLHIMNQCIPHSNIIPSNRLSWINNTVIQAIRKRKICSGASYKRSGNQVDHEKYQSQRNKVVD